MYNEELEKLIDFALADGEITEKEKAVLFRKAKALGIDKEEFEMVLEAKLSLKQQAEPQKKVTVLKCPNCNESLPPLSNVCPSCKYVINATSNGNNDKSLDKLIKKVEDCIVEIDTVPNQTLFGFIGSVFTKRENKLNRLRAEGEQYSRTVRTLYGENKKVMTLIFELESKINKIVSERRKKSLVNASISVVLLVTLGLGLFFSIKWIWISNIHHWSTLEPLITKTISKGDFEKAKKLALQNTSKFKRDEAYGRVIKAELSQLVLNNKPDDAINLILNTEETEYFKKNCDLCGSVIDLLISDNRIKDAEIIFSRYFKAESGWEDCYQKILTSFALKENKADAISFVQKYATDPKKKTDLEYINKISSK